MSRTALKELFLLLIGGGAYYAIEVIYRGYSHWTMALLGWYMDRSNRIPMKVLGWRSPRQMRETLAAAPEFTASSRAAPSFQQ